MKSLFDNIWSNGLGGGRGPSGGGQAWGGRPSAPPRGGGVNPKFPNGVYQTQMDPNAWNALGPGGPQPGGAGGGYSSPIGGPMGNPSGVAPMNPRTSTGLNGGLGGLGAVGPGGPVRPAGPQPNPGSYNWFLQNRGRLNAAMGQGMPIPKAPKRGY